MTFREGDPVRLAGSCLIQCGLKVGGPGNNIAQDLQFKIRSEERRHPLLATCERCDSPIIYTGELLAIYSKSTAILTTPITTLSSCEITITEIPLQPLHHSTISSFSERKRPPASIEHSLYDVYDTTDSGITIPCNN